MVLMFISLIKNNIEHLSKCSLSILIYSFAKYLSNLLPIFNCFVFFLLICSVFYTLDMSLLSDVSSTVSDPVFGFPFHSLTDTF